MKTAPFSEWGMRGGRGLGLSQQFWVFFERVNLGIQPVLILFEHVNLEILRFIHEVVWNRQLHMNPNLEA